VPASLLADKDRLAAEFRRARLGDEHRDDHVLAVAAVGRRQVDDLADELVIFLGPPRLGEVVYACC
jgi:hypothetical protein